MYGAPSNHWHQEQPSPCALYTDPVGTTAECCPGWLPRKQLNPNPVTLTGNPVCMQRHAQDDFQHSHWHHAHSCGNWELDG